eukprot:CAMPEP_0178601200 /NCGR_PEP_ID=MMETSP0697-20121206/34270_1 /TAXON_ID=265572 /ORGANISM="Extubocellulus spinifer, Strain CCMP396" /LENGTH=170 /DNA_ID=CAMNT_0020239261 /DNA_START=31 /DNA_END=540 /DNA_ORIENTATION=+
MTRNENSKGTGRQKKKKKKGRKRTTSNASAGSSGDSTIGLPQTSDDWTPKNMTIPSHQLIFRVPNSRTGAEPHTFVLSVSLSTIPGAGRGLYLTYRGPDEEWKVPDYIDLGLYGPHTEFDIKTYVSMEVKSFLYDQRPSEWSFEAPAANNSNCSNEDQEDSEELDDQGLT